MKTNLLWLLAVPAFLLVSCSEEHITSEAMIFLADQSQSSAYSAYGAGEEKQYDLEYLLEDMSEPEISRSVKRIMNESKKVDAITAECVSKIEQLKRELFRSIGEVRLSYEWKATKGQRPYSKRIPLMPGRYDLSKIHFKGSTDFFNTDNGEKFRDIIEKYRHDLTTHVGSIGSRETANYFFNDPVIVHFKNVADLNKQLDSKINTIAPDFQEAIKIIYSQLSLDGSHWRKILSDDTPWTTVFQLLNSWEARVLEARCYAIMCIRSQVTGCGEYGFTSILPVASGNELAKVGEPLQFSVFIGAFNADKQPIVICNNARLIHTGGGIATLEVQTDKPGEQLITGTITILNKSGVAKTLPWSKRIVVIE